MGSKIMDLSMNSKSCIIVGAGLIGIEVADSFKKRGFDVTIIEMMGQVLPNLVDADMAKIIQEHLESHGVKVLLGNRLERIRGNIKVKGVETSIGAIEGDLVILGTGVRPNSELARDAGIELGYANAIRVDNHMCTNVKDVFVLWRLCDRSKLYHRKGYLCAIGNYCK